MIRLINFILDVAGLLLWLNWRAIRFDPFTRATPATLAGTLKRAEPSRLKRWHFLAGLAALLLGRAWFYWQIGPPANWTLKLDLGVAALAFRSDFFSSTLVFSTLSFLQMLIIFYAWLVVIALINRNATQSDPLQKMVSLQLGRVARWPYFLQASLPIAVVAVLWICLHPLLTEMGITHSVPSRLRLLQHGLEVGGAIYLSLKFLLPTFLCLHLVASYVYLGNSPVWDFIHATSRSILAPMDRLPLRFGKVDLAPVLGMMLILLLLHLLPAWTLQQMILRSPGMLPQ